MHFILLRLLLIGIVGPRSVTCGNFRELWFGFSEFCLYVNF